MRLREERSAGAARRQKLVNNFEGKAARLQEAHALRALHGDGHRVTSLFIFEVTATDPEKTGRPIVVWWFVSGTHAHDIIAYYTKRFTRGARFITFGRWDWDKRRATFSLKLNKPADELEMLPAGREPTGTEEEVVPEVDSKANKSIELDAIDGSDPAASGEVARARYGRPSLRLGLVQLQ